MHVNKGLVHLPYEKRLKYFFRKTIISGGGGGGGGRDVIRDLQALIKTPSSSESPPGQTVPSPLYWRQCECPVYYHQGCGWGDPAQGSFPRNTAAWDKHYKVRQGVKKVDRKKVFSIILELKVTHSPVLSCPAPRGALVAKMATATIVAATTARVS